MMLTVHPAYKETHIKWQMFLLVSWAENKRNGAGKIMRGTPLAFDGRPQSERQMMWTVAKMQKEQSNGLFDLTGQVGDKRSYH